MNMTLHGDPGLLMNSYSNSELKVSDPEIFFTPENITTQSENFAVNVIVTNLGKATNKPFSLKLTRIFSNGNSRDTTVIVTATGF